MLKEDEKIPNAILKEADKIEEAIQFIVKAFKQNGRLFYIGAGTSGRLGILDASECPPTFGTDPDLVQGIIAGGPQAVFRSQEGAEDLPENGAKAVDEYAPYFLYFNNVLWHHGGNPPGQKANPVASGYVASSSYDYVRPENQAEAVIDREKARALNRSDVEAKVASGELAFGSPKDVTERLIEQAEAVGANKLLINVNFGAMPNDLFLDQVRRFGRDVLPKLQAHQVTRVPAAGLVG